MRYSRKILKKEYRGLFNYSLNLVYVLDPNGKFLDCNEIFLKTLGLERNKINEVKFGDLKSDTKKCEFSKLSESFINDKNHKKKFKHDLKNNYQDLISLEAIYIPLYSHTNLYAFLGIAKIINKESNLKRNIPFIESLNQNFLKNTQEGLIYIDKEGNINNVNHRICEILEYEEKELIGKKIKKIINDPDTEFENFVKIGKADLNQKLYLNFWKRMGQKVYTKVSMRSFFGTNDEYQGLVMNIIDITDEVAAKDKLENSLETTNKILENLPIGIILIGYDRRIKRVNKRALEICGYKSEYDLLGKICHKQFCEIDLVDCPIMTLETCAIKSETSILNKTRKKIPILKKVIPITLGKKDMLVEAFMDISEQKEAERKLRESERKYRKLLERAPYPVILTDRRGFIKDINKEACGLLKTTKENSIDKDIFNLNIFPNENDKNLIRKNLKNVQSNQNSKSLEIQLTDFKNAFHWIKLKSTIFNFGKQIYIQTIFNDITEIKKSQLILNRFNKELEDEVEERTRELKEALEEKEKLLTEISRASHFKSQFMATMSHELRTPLNSIIGFSELLLNKIFGNLAKAQEEYLEDIKSSAEHLLELINSIMDISKIEAGTEKLEITEFSVKKVIEQIIAEFIPLIRKKAIDIELKGFEGFDDEILIKADTIKFKSILSNLISNAIKFTLEGKIQISLEQNKEDWIFKVMDTGIGISQTDYNKIFKEFKQIENPYISNTEGIGLGLPLTRRLVGLHGGKIWFESEEGKGSIFSFNIPKSEKDGPSKKIEKFLKFL